MAIEILTQHLSIARIKRKKSFLNCNEKRGGGTLKNVFSSIHLSSVECESSVIVSEDSESYGKECALSQSSR